MDSKRERANGNVPASNNARIRAAGTDTTRHTQRGSGSRRGLHSAPPRYKLPVSLVAVMAAVGVMIVASADTAGRLGYANSGWANRAYWLGQALIVVPIAMRLLGRTVVKASETLILVIILTLAEYAVKICYSPAAFTYPDELAHWRGTVNVLQTGKLSVANYQLPISPHYPGLEELTSALASVTRLSVFVSGLIVAGVAHLLFVCFLYMLFREVSGSYRIAGVAVLCYATNSHFESFDSMFIYQTLALAFLGMTLLAAWRLTSLRASRERVKWFMLAVIGIFATVVTHHVTSYVLVGVLVAIAFSSVLTRRWSGAAWTGALVLLSAATVVWWVVSVAPETSTYLHPFVESTLQSFRALLVGGHSSAPPTSAGPLGGRALAYAAALIISALLPVGWLRVWHKRREPWTVAMVLVSASWYAILAIRLTVADGSEMAGRASTFTFVPVAYIVAVAVGYLAVLAMRWRVRLVAVGVLAVALILMFDGLVDGWPPYWERLPGPYEVAAFERSVTPENIATARWSQAALGSGNRFAADFGNAPLIASYGDQNPVLDVGFLYTSSAYTLPDEFQARALSIRYLLVDQRLSKELPAAGQYFPIDANRGRYTSPIPVAALSKFNHAPGVARIYDSGDIIVYDLDGQSGAP